MRRQVCFALLAIAALPAVSAETQCQLQKFGELPVTMRGTQPLVMGTINGAPATFVADSGAFFSFMTREAAAKYQLRIGAMPPHIHVRGTGGRTSVSLGKADEFSLAGFAGGHIFKRAEFIVGQNIFGGDIVGLIGQNILGNDDTEFDLANGAIRLFRTKDCGGRSLAYWAANTVVGEMKMEPRTAIKSQPIGEAKINGKKIRIVFDTGAAMSILTLKAAARAGITPEDDGVVAYGLSQGLGKVTENSLARFDSLDLGGEVIKNARLRIGDIRMGGDIDMLLGADFFLSHRVYISDRQNKIYFTYNGGPVFDLHQRNRNPMQAMALAQPPEPDDATMESDVPDSNGVENELSAPANALSSAEQIALTKSLPIDAAGFKRRGAAYAARNDFENAIADFDQAIKLEGTDADAFYQRGIAHWRNRHPLLAIKDLDQAIALNPNNSAALLARGSLNLRRSNQVAAHADLDAASAIAPKDVALQMQIVSAFQSAAQYDEVVKRLDKWIAENPKSDRMSYALYTRCSARAMSNLQLDLALADCNSALKKTARNSRLLDGRAFVYLRTGDWEKSIADYKAALKLQPRNAWSMYGLGMAEIKSGLKEHGERTIQDALQIEPNVATRYQHLGLVL